MTTISYKVCRQNGNEFTADASDCGLPPGGFPRVLTYEEPNGEPVVFHASAKELSDEGELLTVTYRCPARRRTLVIFND
jgi:hypothetical protein